MAEVKNWVWICSTEILFQDQQKMLEDPDSFVSTQ